MAVPIQLTNTALWLHLTVHFQAWGLHLIVLLRIQYSSAAVGRPGTQQGPNQWQLGCLLIIGLGFLPHWGLAGGKHSVDTCKVLLFSSTPEGRILLAWPVQAWGKGRGCACGWLPGGGGFSGCFETWALQNPQTL